MKKIVRLTERDLTKLVKRTINEMEDESYSKEEYQEFLDEMKGELVVLLDDATYDILERLGSMYDDIENNESLDGKDRHGLLYEIEEILGDINSILYKYDIFKPKKGFRV